MDNITMDNLTKAVNEFELNGNRSVTTSGSVEDLSEYTDADESMSAPIEILAEFLSAVMLKDYETALKYCKLILQYEPNHATAKEFYPLIQEKINQMTNSSDDDDHENDEEEGASEESSCGEGTSSEERVTDSDGTTASYSSLEDEEANITNGVPSPRPGFPKHDNDFSLNGNTARRSGATSGASDSESPTEPISHKALPSRT